jgi:hypothetical protein
MIVICVMFADVCVRGGGEGGEEKPLTVDFLMVTSSSLIGNDVRVISARVCVSVCVCVCVCV